MLISSIWEMTAASAISVFANGDWISIEYFHDISCEIGVKHIIVFGKTFHINVIQCAWDEMWCSAWFHVPNCFDYLDHEPQRKNIQIHFLSPYDVNALTGNNWTLVDRNTAYAVIWRAESTCWSPSPADVGCGDASTSQKPPVNWWRRKEIRACSLRRSGE